MIERTIFDSDHESFRNSLQKFLESEAEPFHEQWEEDGQVDRELWRKAGQHGFLAPTVPEEYGGVGVDFRYNAIVIEELARLGLSGIGWPLHSDIAVPYIVKYGSDEAKTKYLPGCINGEIITAIGMTEPGTGSDLQSIKTAAKLVNNEYVINGSKTFITNGKLADLVIVAAKTKQDNGNYGISLFLVDTNIPGFSKGKSLKKLGMKAQDTAELFFNDVRVPKENLLGNLGEGFIYMMHELPQERLTLAVGCVAICESSLQHTVNYVKERKAFGKPIANFQNTQFKLAELDAEITAARVFTDKCLELHSKAQLDAVTASKAKLITSELLGKVTDECLQLHGGYGYMWEYYITRAYADARVQRIYGGTSEIMKLIIGRSLLA